MTPALSRRRWLGLGAAALVAPLHASTGRLFAAAWEDAQGAHVGVLERVAGQLEIRQALAVPTRAHGLLGLPDGRVLAVARRPGDWIVQFRAGSGAASWAWVEPHRAFNGHVVASADGSRLFTSETDLETGQGLVAVRAAASLRKLAEWPTHGVDPHDLLVGPAGALWVANGGIRTQPETGRTKRDLHRMDSSLVRLHASSGAVEGQWRLDDARLSQRHLAWGTSPQGRPVLGIALQAEHDTAEERANAPVLALMDGRALRQAQPAASPLQGYGGGIVHANGSFAVTCPRAHGVALFDAGGAFRRFIPLRSACAASARGNQLWIAGQRVALDLAHPTAPLQLAVEGRMDNHWVAL